MTVDKTIVVVDPVLAHDKPTKTDDIDPNTGVKWGYDPETNLPYPDIKDKWPKDPITDEYINPVKNDVPALDDVVNPTTGLPYTTDVETGLDIPKTYPPQKDKEVVKPEPVVDPLQPDVTKPDVTVPTKDEPIKPFVPPTKPDTPL